MYTDEGISGCSTKRREGFQRMISDAMAGKIDLIITKSVSRFARNTVDSLTTIRLLKENNVECYFEKENIWTFDGKGELLLTIMSSISQEEARSISENVTWGHRKRFADGKVSVAYSRFLGYDKGSDGKMVVNPEQAEIVKLIYRLFLEGMTPHTIAIHLTEKGIKTPGGKDKWNATTIRRILTNEKYKGDALLQKEFTVDFLIISKMTMKPLSILQYLIWFSRKWSAERQEHHAIAVSVSFQVKLSAVNAGDGMVQRSGTPPTSTVKLSTAATTNITMSAVLHRTSRKRK